MTAQLLFWNAGSGKVRFGDDLSPEEWYRRYRPEGSAGTAVNEY